MNQPGCPIQKSPDQSSFAAPRSLSQLVTSFIGSWCQGIPLALFTAWPFVWSPFGSQIKVLELCRLLRGINCSLCYPLFLMKSFHKNLFYLSVACLILLISLSRIVQFSRYILWFLFRNQISTLSCLNAEIHFLKCGGLKWTRTTDLALIRRAL